MENKKIFVENLALLAEIFDKEISSKLTDIYWATLKPYSNEQCENAFKKIIATCKFFPKPADFLDILKENEGDIAIQAWEKVDQAMRYIGNYASIDFGDKKIHRCIELLGGWEYLGTLTEDEWKWKRKEFESAYRGLAGNHGTDHVAGICEIENLAHGFKTDIPIQIQIGKIDRKLIN